MIDTPSPRTQCRAGGLDRLAAGRNGPQNDSNDALGAQEQQGVPPGERFAERALSAATCRLRRRSLFTYLSDLIIAHTRGDPFPALT